MQTILGSGGAIGTPLSNALRQYTDTIRLVSRNPKKVTESDLLHPADLTKPEEVRRAVQGSKVCYVTVGFPYQLKVWQATWVPFMKAAIEACEAEGCKLVLFDNMYALSETDLNPITEQGALNPPSKKGVVRAEVDRLVLQAMERGKTECIIARAPDFFGPIPHTSMLMIFVYDNFKKGKGAQWPCNPDMPHSFGYTLELAKGTAMLGNDPTCYNQVWNLPVYDEALTGRQWTALFAELMQKKDKVSTLPAWLIGSIGWFVPVMKEVHEMLYQYNRPYVWNSSKFNAYFNYKPMSNRESVEQTLDALSI